MQRTSRYLYQYISYIGETNKLLKYCKSLKFEEDPNYDYLKQILKDMFIENNYEYDLVFDWNEQASALEKKSTFSHLYNHQQQQIARRQSNVRIGEITPRDNQQKGEDSKQSLRKTLALAHRVSGLEPNSLAVNSSGVVVGEGNQSSRRINFSKK